MDKIRARRSLAPPFMAPTHVKFLEVFPPHEPGGTLNIEHPTPNIEWQRESSLISAFDVRCWTFDVFPRFRGFNARNFRSESSLPEPMSGEGCGGRKHSLRLRKIFAV